MQGQRRPAGVTDESPHYHCLPQPLASPLSPASSPCSPSTHPRAFASAAPTIQNHLPRYPRSSPPPPLGPSPGGWHSRRGDICCFAAITPAERFYLSLDPHSSPRIVALEQVETRVRITVPTSEWLQSGTAGGPGKSPSPGICSLGQMSPRGRGGPAHPHERTPLQALRASLPRDRSVLCVICPSSRDQSS